MYFKNLPVYFITNDDDQYKIFLSITYTLIEIAIEYAKVLSKHTYSTNFLFAGFVNIHGYFISFRENSSVK